jgi:GNAT superfamily N-acetyltransferase
VPLTDKDKKVVDALLDGEPRAGKLLETDGRTLSIVGMNGGPIARWYGGELVEVRDAASKTDATILRYLRKVRKVGTMKRRLQYVFSDMSTDRADETQGGSVAAMLDGSEVGKLVWYRKADGKYFIDGIHVHLDWRRKGVGTAIYQEWMRRLGIGRRDLAPTGKTAMGARFRKAIDRRLPNPVATRGNPMDYPSAWNPKSNSPKEFAYHSTPKIFLENIARNGLLPGEHRSCDEPCIFVEPDEEEAEIYMERGTAMLRFPVDGFSATDDGESVLFGVQVLPETIEVRRGRSWVPLVRANPTKPKGRKLGSMQRAVLQAVLDHGDPYHGVDYTTRCRRQTVLDKLRRSGRKWVSLRPHLHPTVIRGGPQYYLTPEGLEALTGSSEPVRDNPFPTARGLQFLTSCVGWSGRSPTGDAGGDIQKMVEGATDVTRKTFLKHVDRENLREVEQSLGYFDHPSQGLTMAGDYYVSYHRGYFLGKPVYYFVHSAIEYIFMDPDDIREASTCDYGGYDDEEFDYGSDAPVDDYDDYLCNNPTAAGTDRSTHGTVVEYGVREMMKRKSPSTAAKNTAKRLSGHENLFLGPGVSTVDPKALEEALWVRLEDFTINAVPRLKEGFEHFALDGTVEHFRQGRGVRAKLKKRIVKRLGRDPFPNDDRSPKKNPVDDVQVVYYDADEDDQDFGEQAWKLAKESEISILSDKDLKFVAIADGRVVGAVFDALSRADDGEHEYSFDTLVDPEYQGRRIGSRLMDAGLEEFASLEGEIGARLALDVVNPMMVEALRRRGLDVNLRSNPVTVHRI